MDLTVAILVSGSELIEGRVQEVNSFYITQRLHAVGIPVARVAVCGDNLAELNDALRYLLSISTVVIVSGGIGPTADDLTRAAIADVAGSSLELRPDELAQLQQRDARRGRNWDESNKQQAFFPQGAEVLPNSIGTAPGFHLKFEHDQKHIFALSGVPLELEAMFEQGVLPILQELQGGQSPVQQRVLRIFGLSEATVNSLVAKVGLDPSITVGFRAAFPEIQLLLNGQDAALLEESVGVLKQHLGEQAVFSQSLTDNLETVVYQRLLERKWTLAVAESCTGGMLGELLTANSGVSAVFQGGVIAYANDVKIRELGVDVDTINQFGVVSAETAAEMATGVRSRFGVDVALSITGVAGPTGGSAAKPVGTCFVGLALPEGVVTEHSFYVGTREQVRCYTAYYALNRLRLALPSSCKNERN